ncbi:MAG TPA: type II toxin-antitoxin system YafQ family toxin [Bdellovibrionota bacterium]|nr:type II toxin-antitoxin system YafQ family toxin [Bdellovibrionota bacterium]
MIPPRHKIEWSRRFKKDYEKLLESRPKIRSEIEEVVRLLASGEPLPPEYRDHPLKGIFKNHRDCHVRGDLVLIYRIENDSVLTLYRLGTH